MKHTTTRRATVLMLATLAMAGVGNAAENVTLLNVSYDPTRELYTDYNAAFAKYWKAKTGQTVSINQSHGGSGKQARSVIDGLAADVVTLGLAGDVDALVTQGKLLAPDWQTRLPNNSAPYTSTIVFLVRKGNPKKIRDWGDLARAGIAVVTPNPKTSGGARWNYLAGWAWALKQPGGNEATAKAFLKKLYSNAPILDTGARQALTTFAQRNIGDVFISWENEAFLATSEFGKDRFEIVMPSVSILAEPSVAVVDKVVLRKGTRGRGAGIPAVSVFKGRPGDRGEATTTGRAIPRWPRSMSSQFPQLTLSTIKDFGGWAKVQKAHFGDGGVFDQIYARQ